MSSTRPFATTLCLTACAGLVATGIGLGLPACSARGDESTHVEHTDGIGASLVASARSRFRLGGDGVRRPLIGPALASSFEVDQGLVPVFDRSQTALVSLRLPKRASEPARVQDEASGMAIAFTLEGAAPAEVRVQDGMLVYRAVLPGVDAIHRARPDGVEDFLHVQAPTVSEVHYRVELESVAGVRHVAGVVEFLDAGGAPRLRVAAPHLVDADGDRVPLTMRVVGCDADTDPRMPFGRPVTSPGASTCELRVAWATENVAYPVLVDPAWTATQDMTYNRRAHGGALLADGRVLVAGGEPQTASISAEIWDPATGTWTVTGQLNAARNGTDESLVLMGNDKVLMVSGYGLPAEEVYDPATGTWTPTEAVNTPRGSAIGVLMDDGRVLAAGGFPAWATKPAELYDPATNTWSQAGTLAFGRYAHVLVKLNDGRAMTIGGFQEQGANPTNTAEIYDPSTNSWTTVAPMAEERANASGAVLPDGRVVIIGGRDDTLPFEHGTTEIYDPATDSWSAGPSLNKARYGHDARLLADGRFLVIDGLLAVQEASVELLDPNGTSVETAPNEDRRASFTSTLLADGRVLVAGGGNISYSSEVFGFVSDGGTCTRDNECVSNHCVDGVCCDTACTAACNACTASAKGGGDDGVCGPIAAGTDPFGDCGACDVCSGSGTCAPAAPGTDPKNDCRDSGSPACGLNGVCDGAGACDTYPSSGACTPRPCSSNSECVSNHCVDGICCDSGCLGACRACTAAKKGSGVDGVCGPVAADTDPDGECEEGPNYPTSCLADGMCDGAGTCRTFAKDSVSCGASQCISGNAVGLVCNGAGQCLQGTAACEPYICKGDACLDQCADDNDCIPTAFCSAQGACLPKVVAGSPCSTGSQCLSGFCADAVCCNAACTGQCEACNVAPNVGTCSPVVGAPMPGHQPCVDDGDACSGACDGVDRSACQYPSVSVSCGTPTCEDGVAHTSHCDGHGTCVPGADESCGAYACGETTCLTTCEGQQDCAQGYGCAPEGICIPGGGLPDGKPCQDGQSCQSGYCSDGYCCDSACNGQCEACNVEPNVGSCSPVVGAPVGERTPCVEDDECGGACDGVNRAACGYPGSDTVCGESTCSSGVARGSRCNGKGACVPEDDKPCGAYACDEAKCKTACVGPADCAQGYACTEQGVCVPGSTCSEDLTRTSGVNGEVACAPFLCDPSTGRCHVVCSITAECAKGYICDPGTKACIPSSQQTAQAEESGCGCRAPGSRKPPQSAAVLVLLGGVLLLYRKRSRASR